MPDLLLELFSEEIPARMQAKAADDLRRMVTDKLVAEGLVYEGAKAFATPRRLALTVHGIPARQPDLKEERRGPRVGAPEAAIQGFLKATGLASIDEAKIQTRPEEGRFLHRADRKARPRHARRAGRNAAGHHPHLPVAEIDALGRALGEVGRADLGAAAACDHRDLWPRDRRARCREILHRRHRGRPDHLRPSLHGAGAINVRRFEDYEAKLLAAKVVLDPERAQGHHPHRRQAAAHSRKGFELVEDQVLLDEVAGLVEWPVVLMGSFDKEFLSIPGEVIRATIRNNQKCFVVSDPKTGKLTNKFILTANIEASDGGKAIVAGNERVIRARLSRCEILLRDRPEDEAGRPAAEIRADRVSREARHPGRAHQAHRAAGGRDRAAGRRRCRERQSARRIWRRPIC